MTNSRNLVWRTLVGLSLAVLASCARLPTQTPESALDRAAHEQALRALEHWHLGAKIGVRLPGDSGSARLSWKQDGERYRLSLSGPLGQGRIDIEGDPTGVTLTEAGEPPLEAASAEQLIFDSTGWELPVTALRSWVLGLTEPGAPVAQLEVGPLGLTRSFQQEGWQLRYDRYRQVESLYLPGLVVARRPLTDGSEIRLTLAVHEWSLERD